MSHNNSSFTIGLDLGDQFNTFCILDANGEIVQRGQAPNQRASMSRFLRRYAGATVVMETGSHSPWLSRLCAELDLSVLVGNSRKLRAIYQNPGKCDEADAEMLARIGRFDPKLLCPIVHRGAQAQADLAMLKARNQLVSARSHLIRHVRSMVKSVGERLPKCSAPSFAEKVRPPIPRQLGPALNPLLDTIELLTLQIRQYDRDLADLAKERYPETAELARVRGVGPITSLAFVLTIEDPVRFQDARRRRLAGTHSAARSIGRVRPRAVDQQGRQQLPAPPAGGVFAIYPGSLWRRLRPAAPGAQAHGSAANRRQRPDPRPDLESQEPRGRRGCPQALRPFARPLAPPRHLPATAPCRLTANANDHSELNHCTLHIRRSERPSPKTFGRLGSDTFRPVTATWAMYRGPASPANEYAC